MPRRRRFDGERMFGHPMAGPWLAGYDDGRDTVGSAPAAEAWQQVEEGGIGEDAIIAMMDARRAAIRAASNVVAVDFVRRRRLR